jgi:hypothetical protein
MNSHLPSANTPPQSRNDRLLLHRAQLRHCTCWVVTRAPRYECRLSNASQPSKRLHRLAHSTPRRPTVLGHPDELGIFRRRCCAVDVLGQISKHSQSRSRLHARSADPSSPGPAFQQHPDSSSSLAPATSPLQRRRHLSKRPLQSSWRASWPGFRRF